jgi:hypothetical protein
MYRIMSVTRECHNDELVGCPCSGETLDKLIQPPVLAVLAEGPMHGLEQYRDAITGLLTTARRAAKRSSGKTR